MNQKEFTYLLTNPTNITVEQTNAINSIIEEFPYFQSARALYLKGLKNQESFKYNQELKITAAYTTDRSILFDFITSEAFIQNEISHAIKQNLAYLRNIDVTVEDISVNKRTLIDDNLGKQIKDTSGVLDPTLFEPKEPRPNKDTNFKLDPSQPIEDIDEEQEKKRPIIPAIETLKLGKPLEFDKTETHSFKEWLKITSFKPIERSTNNDAVKEFVQPLEESSLSEDLDSERAKKFELIDKFISNNPKIDPKTPVNSKINLAKMQNIQPEELMTETLARIYVEQKNYAKAIQSYKILSLKYPEKSIFFANQIKAVEELQEYNNKE